MKPIARTSIQVVAAMMLILVGWVIGRAQTSEPALELVVNAPSGETTIECVKGCALAWVDRGVNPNSMATGKFTYRCTAARCSSGRVGGWLDH